MLDRLVEVRAALEALVTHDTWKSWKPKKAKRRQAAGVAKLILGSSFWKKADNLLKLLE